MEPKKTGPNSYLRDERSAQATSKLIYIAHVFHQSQDYARLV